MKGLALSTAYATWVQGENDGNWIVRDNTGEKLWVLEGNWNEHSSMAAIRLGREFEKKAFEKGLEIGRESIRKPMETVIENQFNHIRTLEEMNLRLSDKLEKFIIGDDNGPN